MPGNSQIDQPMSGRRNLHDFARVMRRPLVATLCTYGLLAGAALAIFAFGYGPIRLLRGTAISISADAMEHAITAKAIIDQGWYWNIERLSAPFSLPFVMLQFDGLLNTLIMKAMAPFFSNPYALITWFFAATFALSAGAAASRLRDPREDRPLSLPLRHG